MSETTSEPDVPAGERTGYDTVLDRDGVRVSTSPWGSEDEIGRLNWITAESQRAILDRVDGSTVFEHQTQDLEGLPLQPNDRRPVAQLTRREVELESAKAQYVQDLHS